MDDALANSSDPTDSRPISTDKPKDVFTTTLWSVVLDAATHDLDKAASALQKLCSIYWFPIYAFVRRRGSDFHEAEDLTQAFFAHLLEKQTLKKVQRDKGTFRSFLLASLTNFLNNEWDKQKTWKRGGKHQFISLEEMTAETLYRNEPAADLPPEKLFDRRWASLLVDKVMLALRDEYHAANHAALLARLEPLLTQEVKTPGLYTQLAAEFDVSEGAVKVTLHRLRRRFGELLRRELGLTVADEAAIDEEIRYPLCRHFRLIRQLWRPPRRAKVCNSLVSLL